MCSSKTLSVTFTTPCIGEAHDDMSSAAVEIFLVGNATLDIMGLLYIVEEMRMTLPFPFTLKMDNNAARIFCLGFAHKTKPKNSDCHQEWVRKFQDRDIMTPAHVNSIDNDADRFTMILSREPFKMVFNCINDG